MGVVNGDFVKASVSVRLPCERTFELFTAQIGSWWRRGPRFRYAGADQGLIHIEPGIGGRLFESWTEDNEERAFEVGRVTRWDPPKALAFTWRNANFADGEVTQVEVCFNDHGESTMVTVIHRGWAAIREDHPAKHGLEVRAFQRMVGSWWGDQLTSLRMIGQLMTAPRAPTTKLLVAMTGKASPAKTAEGDAPVFAYIASLPQPQRGVAERVDALAAKILPDLQRAVKWGMAYYGVGGGWCFASGAFVSHVKLMFIRGTEIKPEPPVTPIGLGKSTRGVELASANDLDEPQIASWMEQAATMPFSGGKKR